MLKKTLVAYILLLFLSISSAKAATFTVTNNSEGTGVGSLRWALNQAEASAGNDIILFAGDFTITPVGGSRILFFDDSGLLMDTTNLTIIIDGSAMTGDPITWPRVGLRIYDSRYSGAWGRLAKDIEIKGISIQNGIDAGILIERGASDITLTECTLIGDNTIIIDGTLPSSDAAQIVTDITVKDCTFTNSSGNGVIVTQSANYSSLSSTLWSTTTAGIWLNSSTSENASIEAFLSLAGDNTASLTYTTNPITSGTVINNTGNLKIAVLKGSNNEITNSGSAGILVGDYNEIPGSAGGANTITNTGNAALIVGSYNQALNSSSTGNIITNSGYVGGDIYGSINAGTGSSGGDDTITNSGTVAGSIYGADGDDKIIIQRGSVLRGIADGGSGNDSLYFQNAQTVNNNQYKNFEQAYISGIYGLNLNLNSQNTLQIANTVSISNATLSINLPRTLYQDGTSWEIIKANAGITGDFSSINKNFSSETLSLIADKTPTSYNVIVNRKSFADFADSENGKSFGNLLNSLIPEATQPLEDLLITMDFDLNADEIAQTLDNLNPDTYANLPDLTFNAVRLFGQTLYQHQLDLRDAKKAIVSETSNQDWNVSFHLLQNTLTSKANYGMDKYEHKTDGFMTGIDSNFGDVSQIGLFFGYSDGNLTYQSNDGQADLTSYNFSFYASHDFAKFYLDAAASYTTAETDAKRLISTPLSADEGRISFDSDVFDFSLSTGYDINLKNLKISPLASVNYTLLNQESFNEVSTSSFAIQSDDTDNDMLISSLGIKFLHNIDKEKWSLKTRGRICWQYFFNDTTETNFQLKEYPAKSFTVNTSDNADNQLLFNIGLSADYNETIKFYTDYFFSGTAKKNSQTVAGGVAVKF